MADLEWPQISIAWMVQSEVRLDLASKGTMLPQRNPRTGPYTTHETELTWYENSSESFT